MPTTSTPAPGANPFLLAADASPALLPLLRADPAVAAAQDEHGYSLLHALTSYDHLDLLRALVSEFHPPLDLRDEDGETALFVAETVAAASLLVEELGLDPMLRNTEGQIAEEKIRLEGDFTVVADYLGEIRRQRGLAADGPEDDPAAAAGHPPPLPKGMTLNVGTMAEEDAGPVADEAFRQRIQQLVERDDFQGEAGQRELRALVQDAVRDTAADQKEARPRLE